MGGTTAHARPNQNFWGGVFFYAKKMGYRIDKDTALYARTTLFHETGESSAWKELKPKNIIMEKNAITIKTIDEEFLYHPAQVFASYIPNYDFIAEKRAPQVHEGKFHKVAPFQLNSNKN